MDINYITICILLVSIGALIWLYTQTKNKLKNEKMIIPNIKKKELIVISCLIITVCIRSYVGLILSFSWKSDFILALLFVFGVVLGKMFGGILGDRFGFINISISSLVASAILYTLAFNSSVCGILAVLLFNMTMPITLTSLANILNNNKGLAFGLLTFALFLGAVPVFLGYKDLLFNPCGLFFITIFSAVILFIGLKGYDELMEKKYDWKLILSLILTVVLELLMSYILGIRNIKDFCVVILVNIYTNPIVVFLSNIVQLMNNVMLYYCSIFILEIGAVVIEALLYKRYLKKPLNPIRLSIYNNIFSFGMGVILLFIYKEKMILWKKEFGLILF